MVIFYGMKRIFPLFCAVLLFLCACASSPTVLPDGSKTLSGVPFFPQEDYQCGPAALATVMNYWYTRQGGAERIGIDEITKAIYSPGARGVLPSDLENYPKKKGFSAQQFRGSMRDIRDHIDRGIPLILFVEYGLSFYQLNHFLVVTGYTRDGIIVNSGRREREMITNSDLEKVWKKTGYWALRLSVS
jgi:predicted double-glycine peptidase